MASNLDRLREELEGAPWLITDFRLDTSQCRPLGDGTYGEVFAVKWKGSWVAAKRLFSRFFEDWKKGEVETQKTKQMFEQECSLLTRLHHPNIVQLFGVYLPDDYPNSSPVLVMELLDKTLRKRVCTAPRLTLLEIITHSLEIASALRFLQERAVPIIHRDLSSNNIMLTASGHCKVVDLGVAKVFNEAARAASTYRAGHEFYTPTDVWAQAKKYSEKLDNFSLGIIILEMSIGHPPQLPQEFLDRNWRPLEERVRRASDLSELGTAHPLRPLVDRLILPEEDRPAIGEVFADLERLQAIEARRAEGARAATAEMARHATDHDRQLDELRAMASFVLNEVLALHRSFHLSSIAIVINGKLICSRSSMS